jgi:hypothetical protein
MVKMRILGLAAAGLALAAPAMACVSTTTNASNDTENAGAVFVGRVTSVERTDPAECIAAARNRASMNLPGDPGERACEAFGFATLEPAWIIKGEEVVRGTYRFSWNQLGFCSVGWTPEVGTLAIAMIPQDARTLREGVTATVEGAHQSDPLFRIILELVAEIQP